jgi:hypothetical protein
MQGGVGAEWPGSRAATGGAYSEPSRPHWLPAGRRPCVIGRAVSASHGFRLSPCPRTIPVGGRQSHRDSSSSRLRRRDATRLNEIVRISVSRARALEIGWRCLRVICPPGRWPLCQRTWKRRRPPPCQSRYAVPRLWHPHPRLRFTAHEPGAAQIRALETRVVDGGSSVSCSAHQKLGVSRRRRCCCSRVPQGCPAAPRRL